MIDTHCHLDDHRFEADEIPNLLARAHEAGVHTAVTVGCDLASSRACLALAREHHGVAAAIGVHPHEAKHWGPATARTMRELAACPGIVAYGEIGLDFHYNLSEPEVQWAAFRDQLELAGDLGLPVIIHCRDAYDEMLPDVTGWLEAGRTAIMHCWAGTPEQARSYATAGAYLGFGGMVTFKSADAIRQACVETPDHLLLLETDAPWLAPIPYRGSRNEPRHVAQVASSVARLRGSDVAAIDRLTTANALRAYPTLASAAEAGPGSAI
ncbi:MAG: TatD family hydrolase [Armatimonadetes bacterium]|nr:TatD family hydrolase [Armatimonadota bacterium]